MNASDWIDGKPSNERSQALALQVRTGSALHPAWQQFIGFCKDPEHGEIERLAIQDGLPVLAEQVKKKVKFTR